MSYTNLKVGDFVPARVMPEVRGVQRPRQIPTPAWYVLNVHSGREIDVQANLRALGADDVFYPTRTTKTHFTVGPRKGQCIERTFPAVSGYVLLRVSGFPQWDIILGADFVSRALGGVNPIVVKEDVVKQMAQVPDLLADIVEAERVANIISIGDQVEVIGGALNGSVFFVTELTASHVVGDLLIFGRTKVRREFLQKVLQKVT